MVTIALGILGKSKHENMFIHKYEYEVVVLCIVNFCINEGLLLHQKGRGIQNNLHFHEITLL